MTQSPGLEPRMLHPDKTMEHTTNFHDREIQSNVYRKPEMQSPRSFSMGVGVGKGGYFPIKVPGVIVTPKISKICGLVLLRVR